MKNEDSFIQDAVGKGTEVDRDWGDYGFVLEITWSCEPLIVRSHSCRHTILLSLDLSENIRLLYVFGKGNEELQTDIEPCGECKLVDTTVHMLQHGLA